MIDDAPEYTKGLPKLPEGYEFNFRAQLDHTEVEVLRKNGFSFPEATILVTPPHATVALGEEFYLTKVYRAAQELAKKIHDLETQRKWLREAGFHDPA